MPSIPPDPDALHQEVLTWFFDAYLPRWVAHATGRPPREPAFILDYWDVPLLVAAEAGATWLPDEAAVLGFLALTMERLRADRYDHTAVLDRRVRVYHAHGAALDVVWSRRRADGTETQRTAMHYELARAAGSGAAGWRVVALQAVETGESLIPW